MPMSHILVPLILLLSSIYSSSVFVPAFAETDAQPLLLFKSSIQKDPKQVLSTWQTSYNSTSPCMWWGVTCNGEGRVTRLDLAGCGLGGHASLTALSAIGTLCHLNLSANGALYANASDLSALPRALSRLDLSATGLAGRLPDDVLTHYPNLTYISLACNNLTGALPERLLAGSSNIQSLDVSGNNLSGDISGVSFGESLALAYLDLSGNRFTGTIPTSLSACAGLRMLNLSYNGLAGPIPESLSYVKGLEALDISSNHLSGPIPYSIGNTCSSLKVLKASSNNISGDIPESLAACRVLRLLDIANNNISGDIPAAVLGNLTSVESLLLSNNFISGSLPSTISSCKNLRVADFSSNKLSGELPGELCTPGAALEELRMPDNLVIGTIPPGLSNCSRLRVIDFSINYLHGPIPPELGRLRGLEHLMMWFNGLGGRIPAELGQCRSLRTLILNNNFIGGDIPAELFNCTGLEWISLTSNQITGTIRPEFGWLSRLAVLQLANNSLEGVIPKELGNCSSLMWLDLNSNRLTGEIPRRLGRQLGSTPLSGILSSDTLAFVRNVGNSCKGVGGLLEFAGIRPERLLKVPTLKSCDFTRLYSGAAVSGWTRYQTLEYLDLSYNNLEGVIPEEFGDMVVLQVLDLARNKLTGEIPASLGRLRFLGVFEASKNRLQGSIPESFSNLSFLVQIDLSDNNLTGEIPQRGQLITLPASQYAGNPGLCGVPLPPCRGPADTLPTATMSAGLAAGAPKRTAGTWANSVIMAVLVSVALACAASVWAVAMRARRKVVREAMMLSSLQDGTRTATTWKLGKEKEALSINVATFQRQLRKLTFMQLIEATNGFSAASLIGSGGFGEVFKATLKDGSCVAIKKLIHLSYQGDREFMAEMETLGKIKHKNLVPLLGYCKIGEERLLVYEFMSHGSLEDTLHGPRKPGDEAAAMGWEERKKVARGAARGLCFLHHNCIPHIIHRDMKSSNVLLDGEMDARVADFGMARLISALDTHLSVSTLAGTPGYVPPEYYQSFRCTVKGDVYSFGVVLLELLTGRRPTDKEDFGDTNLVGWVKMKVREGNAKEVVDAELVKAANGDGEKEMARFLEIALQCLDDFPSKRPNMLQVVAMLRELHAPAPSPAAANGEDA